MKHPYSVLISALAIGLALFTSSCSAFSKTDAIEIGATIAHAGVDFAGQKLAGENVNAKQAGRELGVILAAQITRSISDNLAQGQRPLAAAVVRASGLAAESLLNDAKLETPEAKAAAMELASATIREALVQIQAPPSPVPNP